LINVYRFHSIIPPCSQVPTNFKFKYFFSARVLGEVLVVDELHCYDALESNSMGGKRNYMPSYEL
jgi:hypothetical protein